MEENGDSDGCGFEMMRRESRGKRREVLVVR